MARLRQGGRKKWSPGMREECLGGLLLSPTPRRPGGREHRLWQAGPGQHRETRSGPRTFLGPGALTVSACVSPRMGPSPRSLLGQTDLSHALPPICPVTGPQLRGHLSSLLDGRELVLSLGRASGSSFRLSSLRSGFMSPSYWEFLQDRGRDTSSPRPGWVGRGRETERRGLHPHSFRSKTSCPHACLQSGEPVGAH